MAREAERGRDPSAGGGGAGTARGGRHEARPGGRRPPASGHRIRFLIITGMSGAGKSQAVHALEDLGYFCVDNLPPTLLPKFAQLCAHSGSKISHTAVVVDIRGGEFFDHTFQALKELEKEGLAYEILFLEADDDTLVRRYKETRRRHPLAPQGGVLEGIAEERRRLEPIKGRAQKVIDTSHTTSQGLREQMARYYGKDERLYRVIVTVLSFGFKHGLPLDADLVFDVRFLPNPQYVKSLRDLDGTQPSVAEYMLRWPITDQVVKRLASLLDFLLPLYVGEGKTQLVVAVGCTGGRHRSVVVAERLAELLKARQRSVLVQHRDMGRGNGEG